MQKNEANYLIKLIGSSQKIHLIFIDFFEVNKWKWRKFKEIFKKKMRITYRFH